jgi:VWFA-related protein
MGYNRVEKEFDVLPMLQVFRSLKLRSPRRILQLRRPAHRRSRFSTMAILIFLGARLNGVPRAERQASGTEHALPFEVTSNAVEVDVIARNSRGDYVEGLEASDFKLYENDAPQKITLFVPPGRLGSGSTGAPQATLTTTETVVGVRPGAAQDESSETRETQFITVVIDLADLQPSSVPAAIGATAEYLSNTLSPDNYVSVFWIGGSLHLLVPVTRSRDEAVRAVKSLAGKVASGLETRAERDATRQEIESVQGMIARVHNPARVARLQQEAATLKADLGMEDTLQARAVFVALRALAEQYRSLPGRKCVIFFSDDFSPSPEVESELSAVIDAANRSGVSFYVVAGSGLAPPSTTEALARTTPSTALSSSRYKPRGDGGGFDEFDTMRMGPGAGLAYLNQLAEETGGLMVGSGSSLGPTLAEVDRDLHEYYTLVYQPSDTNYNGAFRRVRVEVLRPGCHLRYRQGYWGIPFREETLLTPAAQQLLASAAGGSTKPDSSVVMNAALLFDAEGHPSLPVTIQFPTTDLNFEREGDHYVAGITLVVVARDASGRLVGVCQRFEDVKLTKEGWKDFMRKPTALEAQIRVPRLESLNLQGVIQFSGRNSALVEGGVTTPAVETGPKLTTLLLTNRLSRASGPPDSGDPLRIGDYQMSLPPRAVFSQKDQVTMLIGALDLPFDPVSHAPEFDVLLAILSGTNTVMSDQPDRVQYSGSGATGRALLARQVSLKGLAAGHYVAKAVVTDHLQHSTWIQSTQFEIH